MNILTFDIEDWYNCDFISDDLDWSKHEVRIYESVDRILNALSKRNIKGSFFCLGWLADNHPNVIKKIHREGHHIGCHSYHHQLVTKFNKKEFIKDTLKAKTALENIIGEAVTAYRAPGFSITTANKDYLFALNEMGFEFDCSIFPAYHDYGGMPKYGISKPNLIRFSNGEHIKEFPINTINIFGKPLVFSGGGFFRILPYFLIRKLSLNSNYLMTYFHPRDFDYLQPRLKNLPSIRYFKSYVGIKRSFNKFEKLLDEFEFINLLEANELIDWNNVKELDLNSL